MELKLTKQTELVTRHHPVMLMYVNVCPVKIGHFEKRIVQILCIAGFQP